MKVDPYELHNLYDGANVQLVNRLDALLVVLKSCRAETCRDPWSVLHPNDDSVKTLKDALNEQVIFRLPAKLATNSNVVV